MDARAIDRALREAREVFMCTGAVGDTVRDEIRASWLRASGSSLSPDRLDVPFHETDSSGWRPPPNR